MRTFKVANLNAYNLVRAGVPYYSEPAYSNEELDQKLQWTSGILRATNADLIGFQEVFHEEALQDALARTGPGFDVRVPGATRELNEAGGKALGPKLGLASRFPITDLQVIFDFPADAHLTVPILHPDTQVETSVGIGFRAFNRPVLKARILLPNEIHCTVFVAHLKSKRSILLDSEDPKDPMVKALGTIRALLMRGAEAAALRALIVSAIRDPEPGQRGEPCIVLGDLNDGISAVTTVATAGEPPFFRLKSEQKKPIWDVLLYNAFDIQARRSLESFAFSHIWNGRHELLDHILVSQEFVREFPNRIGEVLNARVLTDHLVDETLTQDRKTRIHSDHGVPVAEISLLES